MASTVNVFVVSPDTRSERRYDLSLTIGGLKVRLMFAQRTKPPDSTSLGTSEQTGVDHWDTRTKPVDICLCIRRRTRTCDYPLG